MFDDPRDYIDLDEGRDLPEPFYALGEPCENCGKACDPGSRVHVPGFNYWGCSDCAAEASIIIFAEENCPALYRAITRARRVSEVQRAFRWHRETCPKCNPKISPLPVRKQSAGERKQEKAA